MRDSKYIRPFDIGVIELEAVVDFIQLATEYEQELVNNYSKAIVNIINREWSYAIAEKIYEYRTHVIAFDMPTPACFEEFMKQLQKELRDFSTDYTIDTHFYKCVFNEYNELYEINKKKKAAIYRAINLLCRDMKIASVYTTDETIRQYCIDNNISMTDKIHRTEFENGLGIVVNSDLEYVRDNYNIGSNSAYMSNDHSLHYLISAIYSGEYFEKIQTTSINRLLTWIEQDKEEIMRIAA